MIDTDKYEGHTQGHWATTTRKGTWVVYTQNNGDVATMNNYEDAKLIAHAPLLLAEVKRLQRLEQGHIKQVGRLLEEAGKHSDEVKRLHEEYNVALWHRREWLEKYLESKGMSCADVAQRLENFENYRGE